MHVRNAKAYKTADGIPRLFRTIFIGMGIIAILAGMSAWAHGPLWVRSYNARIGQITTETPVAFVGIGFVFVVIGLMPWGGIARKIESKRTRRR